MSIALEHFCFTESVVMPIAVVLSHRTMVSGCGYPISESIVRSTAACWALANRAAYSASPALATAHGITVEKPRIIPLILVGLSTSPKKNGSPARDRACDRALTRECKTISH
jgi:hypothetical protein